MIWLCLDLLEIVLCQHPVESNVFDTAACYAMGLELVHVTYVLYAACTVQGLLDA